MVWGSSRVTTVTTVTTRNGSPQFSPRPLGTFCAPPYHLGVSSIAALEVTITHNLDELAEVTVLFTRRLIALDWGRKGPDPDAYAGRRAKQDVRLFHNMREKGAAVIASYKGASEKRSDRVIGWVEPGSEFVGGVNDLLCLPLSRARVVDSSKGFLGNLAPRQCAVQTCHTRAQGNLAAAVLGTEMPRNVWSLHTLDVEWLATNFLITEGLC